VNTKFNFKICSCIYVYTDLFYLLQNLTYLHPFTPSFKCRFFTKTRRSNRNIWRWAKQEMEWTK